MYELKNGILIIMGTKAIKRGRGNKMGFQEKIKAAGEWCQDVRVCLYIV